MKKTKRCIIPKEDRFVKIRRIAIPLLVLFAVFSCTDLQTANEDVQLETKGKTNWSGELQSGPLLLAEPDTSSYNNSHIQNKVAKGSAKLYKRVMVHPKGASPGRNGAPVVDNFSDALERVETGGVVKVFGGEYELDEMVVINRSVTIEPMGNATVVISSSDAHVFWVNDVQDGMVTLKDITFKNIGGHSSVNATASEVLVTGSTFDSTNGSAGAFAGEDAKLTIEESSFSNGVVGAFASGENTILNVHSSSFTNHAFVTLQYQFGADGFAEDNSMIDCGTSGCTRAFLGSELDMQGNYFSDDISDSEVDGFFHHIVIYSGADGVVSDNHFDGCGHGQCIAGIDGSVLEVSNNEFTIYEDHKTRFVIVGSDGTGGQDPYGREVDMTVTDNIITGIGGDPESDPQNGDAYAIKMGGILIEHLGKMKAQRNTVENANRGITVSTGAVLSSGVDNHLHRVRIGVEAYDWNNLGSPSVNLQSNDFTSYYASFESDGLHADSDLNCNWWGSAAGPNNPELSLSPNIYTPWATEPVAGSSVTNCTGVPNMPTSGLIAYWPGDGTAEDVAGNHDGTLVDDATFYTGKVNQAFYFPNTEKAEENGYHGSDWVEVPDHDAWDFSSGDFTIGTWVNFSSVFSSGDNQQPIIGHTEGPGELNKWIFWLENGAITFHINTPDETGHSPIWYSLNPDDDTWYHLTLTHEGDTWRLYVDGNLEQEIGDPIAIPDANFALEIGKAEEQWLEGFLDEIVIYDRALNSNEVLGLFLEGAG